MRRRGWRLKGGLGVLAIGAVVLAAVAGRMTGNAGAQDVSAGALLRGTAGQVVGTATFSQEGNAVRVTATVQGMPAGFHGFHIHTVGLCEADNAFMSAGGHYNPGMHDHADHAGDQPILYVKADGTGALSFLTDRYSVAELLRGDPHALMVHALADNFGNIPERYAPSGPDETTRSTGDAGARIACGVIQAGK